MSNPKKYVEFAALSRAGLPVIAAAVHELEELFPIVKSDQTARQFCGAVVGEVMRDAGHEILRPRGRVCGNLFTYGTVWTPFPVDKEPDQIVQIMLSVPRRMSVMLDSIPIRFLQIEKREGRTSIGNRIVEMISNDLELCGRIEGKSATASGDAATEAQILRLTSQNGALNVEGFNTQFKSCRATLCQRLVYSLEANSKTVESENLEPAALRDAIRLAHDADQVLLNELQEFVLELSFGS
ncbi:MAG: hypothetical protein ACR2RE_08650 [Geminicoccaceae bacterium]